MKPSGITPRDEAELVAAQTLAFLAGDAELLVGFLSHTGLTSDSIRAAAQSPGFLVGVMDYVRERDWLIEEAAEHIGITIPTWINACLSLSGAHAVLVQASGPKADLPSLPRRSLYR
ncbi:DUF3572 family protein [Aquabacter sp. CN5-332]|uniref:DUF3572 family protein n=1 Tax=Aquabacter sp. CN5-332 TaxID=3156608 RepID=UPI0032B52E34